ncbi:hypothetical protein BT69DRAFT_887033 [Atractiella rhizophila]|nr:hypothetical protein BT69DRAFT_887033 [Atractiella rhizophila]
MIVGNARLKLLPLSSPISRESTLPYRPHQHPSCPALSLLSQRVWILPLKRIGYTGVQAIPPQGNVGVGRQSSVSTNTGTESDPSPSTSRATMPFSPTTNQLPLFSPTSGSQQILVTTTASGMPVVVTSAGTTIPITTATSIAVPIAQPMGNGPYPHPYGAGPLPVSMIPLPTTTPLPMPGGTVPVSVPVNVSPTTATAGNGLELQLGVGGGGVVGGGMGNGMGGPVGGPGQDQDPFFDPFSFGGHNDAPFASAIDLQWLLDGIGDMNDPSNPNAARILENFQMPPNMFDPSMGMKNTNTPPSVGEGSNDDAPLKREDPTTFVDQITFQRIIDYLSPSIPMVINHPKLTPQSIQLYLHLYWTRVHETQFPA